MPKCWNQGTAPTPPWHHLLAVLDALLSAPQGPRDCWCFSPGVSISHLQSFLVTPGESQMVLKCWCKLQMRDRKVKKKKTFKRNVTEQIKKRWRLGKVLNFEILPYSKLILLMQWMACLVFSDSWFWRECLVYHSVSVLSCRVFRCADSVWFIQSAVLPVVWLISSFSFSRVILLWKAL